MLLLDNETIAQVLTMKACIDAQERAFRRLATGEAIHRPRIDLYAPTGRSDDYFRWGSMEGADSVEGIFAIRVKSDIVSWPRSPQGYWTEEKYCREPGTYCGLIWLFSTRTGEPLAILQDGYLQHLRVGGGAGLGVRYLARQDSRTVAILGSGGMARTYLEAICLERPIERVRVYSPTPAHRQTFAEEMSAKLEIAVEPVDTPQAAVVGADIVATCTDSMQPVLFADWLQPGMHCTNLGPAEWEEGVYGRGDVVVRQGTGGIDLPESEHVLRLRGHSPVAYVAGTEAERARIPQIAHGPSMFTRAAPSIVDVMTGRCAGRRRHEDITLYINVGNQGLQFAAVGQVAYQEAMARGLGRTIPTEWFLQHIRD